MCHEGSRLAYAIYPQTKVRKTLQSFTAGFLLLSECGWDSLPLQGFSFPSWLPSSHILVPDVLAKSPGDSGRGGGKATMLWCGWIGKISLSHLHLHMLSEAPAIGWSVWIQTNGWSCSMSIAWVRYFWCQYHRIDEQSGFCFLMWKHNQKGTSNGPRNTLLWYKVGKDLGGQQILKNNYPCAWP